jgi:hypothetical protein
MHKKKRSGRPVGGGGGIQNADVRQIRANLQHFLVEKLESSAPNTATRIILAADGAKRKNDKQCEFVCD